MSFEHPQSPLLEEFVQRHHLTSKEKEALQKWFDYSERLSERIIHWYNFQDTMHKEVMAAAEMRGDQDELYDVLNPAERIIPFFERNYDTIATLPPAIGAAICLPAMRYSASSNEEEAQGVLDDLVAFLRVDDDHANRLPSQRRENVVGVIGIISAWNLDESIEHSSRPMGFSREEVSHITEVYQNWWELRLTDRTGIGPILLLSVAQSLALPALTEDDTSPNLSQIAIKVKEYREYMDAELREGWHILKPRYNFELLWKATQAYKRHFNPQSSTTIFPGTVVPFLLESTLRIQNYLHVSEPASIRMEKPFEYLGKLQKQLEGIELPFPIVDVVQTTIRLLKEKKYDLLDKLGGVVNRNQCQTLEEAMECAELNLQLESSGYQVHRRITSEGTFKEVYLAEDRFGTECVLKKIIDEEVAAVLKGSVTPEGMARKELKSSPFQMRHPNINPTMPLFSGKTVYLLEPKYEETMAELVRQRQRYAFGRDQQGDEIVLRYSYARAIISVMCQMASALEYCHNQGVVHGDFKLDNVGIINPKWGGEEIHALLSDFGMATYDQQLTGKEEFNYNLGRVYTKHPDLFRKGSHPSKQTDIFAFGAELFFLCTGRYPFSEEDEITDYRQLEERKKYHHRVHSLVKKGKDCWKEALEQAVERYMPSGVMAINVGAFVMRPTTSDSRVTSYKLAEELRRLNKYCFNQGSSANNNPFEGITTSFNLILREMQISNYRSSNI